MESPTRTESLLKYRDRTREPLLSGHSNSRASTNFENGGSRASSILENGGVLSHVAEFPAQLRSRQTPSSISGDGYGSSLDYSERESDAFPTVSDSNGVESDLGSESALNEDEDGSENGLGITTLERRLLLVILCLMHFYYGAYYAMLGAFFSALCDEKNLSSTMTGVLMGVFEWIVIFSALVYGRYISNIGAKFMYLTGAMAFGYCVFLMGLLEYCPPDLVFVGTTFAIRVMENFAVSALLTASFAIIAQAYPDSVASMFGVLELANGIGMMLGPVLGGVLHDAGGFKLPFFTVGTMIMATGLIGVFIVPSLQGVPVSLASGNSMFSLLRVPRILMMSVIVFVGSSVMSFYDVALSVFLKYSYDLSAVMVGVVFMVSAGLYSITAPLWGRLADKKSNYCGAYIIVGFLVAGISQQFTGPAPFIPLQMSMKLVYTSMAFAGVGLGSLVVTFEVITTAASAAGHPDNLDTLGLISGLWNSCFSLGAFFGSVVGGLLYDYLDFGWASSIVGMMLLASAAMLFVYSMCEAFCSCCVSQRDCKDEENNNNDIVDCNSLYGAINDTERPREG